MLFGLLSRKDKHSERTNTNGDGDGTLASTISGLPERPATPQLCLNGQPIAAPTSFASPRKSLRRSSSPHVNMARQSKSSSSQHSSDIRQRRGGGGGGSGKGDAGAVSDASIDTLKPVPYTAKSSGSGSGKSKAKPPTSQPPASQRRKTVPRRPSPFSQPISYARYLSWRTRVYFDATFSLGMLAEWEVMMVATIAIISALVLLYSLFFQFPKHFQTVMKRATYYVWGVGTNALAAQQQQQQQQSQAAATPLVRPDGQPLVGHV